MNNVLFKLTPNIIIATMRRTHVYLSTRTSIYWKQEILSKQWNKITIPRIIWMISWIAVILLTKNFKNWLTTISLFNTYFK